MKEETILQVFSTTPQAKNFDAIFKSTEIHIEQKGYKSL
jgi:hypothetical protein